MKKFFFAVVASALCVACNISASENGEVKDTTVVTVDTTAIKADTTAIKADTTAVKADTAVVVVADSVKEVGKTVAK